MKTDTIPNDPRLGSTSQTVNGLSPSFQVLTYSLDAEGVIAQVVQPRWQPRWCRA